MRDNRNQGKVQIHKKPSSQARRGRYAPQDLGSASPPDPHHALVTLDHEAFILVEATDTADNIIILLVPALLLRD